MTRWSEMLDTGPGVAMVLDHDLRIVDVGWRNWSRFWTENGGGEVPDLIGRDVTNSFSPGPVRDTFRLIFNDVLLRQRPIVRLDFRCDSPDFARMMRLTVSPLIEDGQVVALLYRSEPLWTRAHDALVPTSPPVDQVCMVCARVTPEAGDSDDFARWDWTPPLPTAPRPAQTLCPQCHLELLSAQIYA